MTADVMAPSAASPPPQLSKGMPHRVSRKKQNGRTVDNGKALAVGFPLRRPNPLRWGGRAVASVQSKPSRRAGAWEKADDALRFREGHAPEASESKNAYFCKIGSNS